MSGATSPFFFPVIYITFSLFCYLLWLFSLSFSLFFSVARSPFLAMLSEATVQYRSALLS